MSANRIKLTKPVVATRAQAETVLGEIAADTAKLNRLKANLDSDLTLARQRYESQISALAILVTHRTGLLQQWAEANPQEFTAKKSIETLYGYLGFRTGMPKLKTLAGWTWDKVVGALDSAFVRVKREADKEGMLAAHQRGDLDDADLRAAGVRVVQDESFFVEPKMEEPAGRIVA